MSTLSGGILSALGVLVMVMPLMVGLVLTGLYRRLEF